MTKLLAKISSIVLSEQRSQASRIGHTLLLPAEHELTVGLTRTKEAYAGAQPVKEAGKAGQKHPWGAPRNVNTAQLFDITIEIYKKQPALMTDAIKIWGKDHGDGVVAGGGVLGQEGFHGDGPVV